MAQFNAYKVRLVSQRSESLEFAKQEKVIFEVSPELSESRTVNYSSVDPVHMPGQIYVFKNVQARTFNINTKLVSRTPEEAERNLGYLWTLKGWQMPRFGINSVPDDIARLRTNEAFRNQTSENAAQALLSTLNQSQSGQGLMGSPPDVLLLSAYSGTSNSIAQPEHIRRVPVVLQTLNIPYPTDCDWVTSTNGTQMPTIWQIDLTLLEAHSPREYEAFNLEAYKKGILPNF